MRSDSTAIASVHLLQAPALVWAIEGSVLALFVWAGGPPPQGSRRGAWREEHGRAAESGKRKGRG